MFWLFLRLRQVQARIVEVQRQLHELEATLEMNPGQELSDDEARLVQQLENLKIEFGEMLYELRHKLNVHVASDVIDDVSIQFTTVFLTLNLALCKSSRTQLSLDSILSSGVNLRWSLLKMK